ncbi:MAG TPA: hypothetical protein VEW92_09285 [Nitrososphaeraceae archaeon]|nr:hypothetical protein [Nitrososphaeraceae archaeon]
MYSHIGSKMAARRNTKPKKETPKEPKEIIIKPAKEIKETKSVPITVELNILKVLINERPLIPLLRVLKKNKELHTRELLITMGSWGYGQSLMKRATNLGLIERKVKKEKSRGRGKPRIYNALTNKGREVVKLADRIGYEK